MVERSESAEAITAPGQRDRQLPDFGVADAGEGGVPVSQWLILAESWTDDHARLEHAGVPVRYRSAQAKTEIALAELDRHGDGIGAPPNCRNPLGRTT